MGNTQGRRSSQQRKLRKRPHSIAVEKPERWPESSKPSQLQRSASQGSLRKRYTESGNYSYKTPWPVPLSEAVFLPEYDSKQPVKISDFEVCLQTEILKNSFVPVEVSLRYQCLSERATYISSCFCLYLALFVTSA